MAAIFGDSFLPKPLVVQPGAPAESTTSVDDDPNLSAASRVRPAPCTLYEQSFASRADVPVQEEDAHLWAKAVGKWCTIFLLAHSDPGQVGVQAAQCLAAEGEAARDELLVWRTRADASVCWVGRRNGAKPKLFDHVSPRCSRNPF